MPPEIALLESRALRASVSTRTEALDKVKALILLPDGLHVTTQMVADYFEVDERAVNALMRRHREELESNGFRILTGGDAVELRQSCKLQLRQAGGHGLAVYPRRAVLNVAMLLRDSEVARRVRRYLLDTEAASVRHDQAPPPAPWGMPSGRRLGPGPHWDEYEYLQANPQAATPEQYTAADRVESWPTWAESVDRRLDAYGRLLCAVSEQLRRVADDVRELRRRGRR